MNCRYGYLSLQAVRDGFRVKFFNLVDLANQLEQEKLAGKGGRLSERLTRYTEFVVLDDWSFICCPICTNGPP